MDARQIEEEVEALEPKVERLKALYEQYFMGLEKIEPTTLRTEVERKFWDLRKRRIQATRIRFRLQMLIQRYNSYQQYWARVTREMERGTYMRDVMRVARRIGSKEAMTILGQKRARMFRDLARIQEERKERRREGQLTDDGTAVATAVAGETSPGAAPDGADAHATGSEPAAPPSGAVAGAGPAMGSAQDDLEDPTKWDLFSDSAMGELEQTSPLQAPPGPAPSPTTTASAPALAGRRGGSLDDEPDDDDAVTLPPPANGAAPAPAVLPKPAGLPKAAGLPKPPLPKTAGPPQPPPPKQPPPPAAAARKAPAAGGDADETRMRQIYDDYVAAKRRSSESVDGISYEKLRRSLKRQSEQIRASHGERKVDFEVVTKDGRTLIRPVVR